MPTLSVECQNITVKYGNFTALQDVSLQFFAGKIHALVGQNGAGKTSLARVLAGLVAPAAGHFSINGKSIQNGNVHLVREAGLDIVHQRFTLPPKFTVAEALELASAKKQVGAIYSANALSQAWHNDLAAAGVNVPPTTRIQDLPVEVAQSLEILRALSGQANVLILDEPTALLSPSAIDNLFARMRKLRDEGVTILVILHKLREVLEISETVSVLRGGRLVLPPTATTSVTAGELSDLIIGSGYTDNGPVEDATATPATLSSPNKVTLALRQVDTPGTETEPPLKQVSLGVQAGEIVGMAGVEGNGQRGIVNVLTGQTPAQRGQISLLEQDVTHLPPLERRQIGLRVVPFDRMTEGSSLTLPLWENVMAWQAEKFTQGWLPWLPMRAIRQAAKKALDSFEVKYNNLDQPAGSLSGGNLQRLILARELADGAKIVIAAQPTRGLDFQATDFVWQVLNDLKATGAGVLLVSSDLDELFKISDRVVVVRAGEIAGEFAAPFDQQAVGDAMIGAVR